MPSQALEKEIDPSGEKTPTLEVIEGGKDTNEDHEPPKLSVFEKLARPLGGDKFWEKIAKKLEPKEPNAKPFKMSMLEKTMASFGGTKHWEKIANRLEEEDNAEKAIAEFRTQAKDKAQKETTQFQTDADRTTRQVEAASKRIDATAPDITGETDTMKRDADTVFVELENDLNREDLPEPIYIEDNETSLKEFNKGIEYIQSQLPFETLTLARLQTLEKSYTRLLLQNKKLKGTPLFATSTNVTEKMFDNAHEKTNDPRKKEIMAKEKFIQLISDLTLKIYLEGNTKETIKKLEDDYHALLKSHKEYKDTELYASQAKNVEQKLDMAYERLNNPPKPVEQTPTETTPTKPTPFKTTPPVIESSTENLSLEEETKILTLLDSFIDEATVELIVKDPTREKLGRFTNKYRDTVLNKIAESVREGKIKLTKKMREEMTVIDSLLDNTHQKVNNPTKVAKKTTKEPTPVPTKETTPPPTTIEEPTAVPAEETPAPPATVEEPVIEPTKEPEPIVEEPIIPTTPTLEKTDATEAIPSKPDTHQGRKDAPIEKSQENETENLEEINTDFLNKKTGTLTQSKELLGKDGEPNKTDYLAKQKLITKLKSYINTLDSTKKLKKIPKIGGNLKIAVKQYKKTLKALETDLAKDKELKPDLAGFTM